MDELDALAIYKNSMQNIYYRYNPSMKRIRFDRDTVVGNYS